MSQRPIEEIVEHVAEVCDSVEFLRGVPVKLPSETKALLRGRIRKAIETERRQADERLRGVLRAIVDTFDESDNEVARNVVLFYAAKHHIDINRNLE